LKDLGVVKFWYILIYFSNIFLYVCNLVYFGVFFPVLECCTKTNLATPLRMLTSDGEGVASGDLAELGADVTGLAGRNRGRGRNDRRVGRSAAGDDLTNQFESAIYNRNFSIRTGFYFYHL
jgi:hypothetical protein